MRITLDRDPALTIVARAQAVVRRGDTIPILQDLLLTAANGRLIVRGTDLEMEVSGDMPAGVEEGGEVAVAATRLHDVLRNLPAGSQLALSLSATRLTVTCGRSRFVLPTLPAQDFPVFGREDASARATLRARDLGVLLERVAFVMAAEQPGRCWVAAALLQVVEGRLRAVATDGNRLGYAEIDCPAGWESAPDTLVPMKAVGELGKLLDVTGEAEIWTNGRLFGARVGSTDLATKLLSDTYPEYGRVIPASDQLQRVVLVDGPSLTAGLRRCALMSADKMRSVRFALEPGRVVLRSRDGEGGEAEEPIEAQYDGDPVELGFNGRFLQEIAAQASRTVSIRLGGPSDPARLEDADDGSCVYVLMPLRV